MMSTAYLKCSAVAFCLFLSAAANADNSYKNPRNTPIHPETSPVLGGLKPVSHSFAIEDLERFAAVSKIGVIVHHGEQKPPVGFSQVYAHRELVQPVGGEAAGSVVLSRTDLEAILAGKVVNWSEVGGPEMPISIHAHNGRLNRKALEWQLGSNNLELEIGVQFHESYELLAEAVSNDPGALGFGLRSAARLRDGIVDVAMEEDALSSQPVAVFVRNDSAPAAEMGKAFVDIVKARLAEDNLAAPAEQPKVDIGS